MNGYLDRNNGTYKMGYCADSPPKVTVYSYGNMTDSTCADRAAIGFECTDDSYD